MLKQIVVADMNGKVPAGSMFEGHLADHLRQAGCIVLPVDPDLFERNPVSGYFERCWGPGWRWAGERPTRGCPMLLFVTTGVKFVHWAARAVPTEEPQRGVLRLTSHGAVQAAGVGGLSASAEAVNLATLGAPDEHGGWNVGGQSAVSLSQDGYLSLSLYGACSGIKVLFTAVSCTQQ